VLDGRDLSRHYVAIIRSGAIYRACLPTGTLDCAGSRAEYIMPRLVARQRVSCPPILLYSR